jgi:hypothetical protein
MTLDRREIDTLIDGGHRLALIKVKSATTVAADDFKHLNTPKMNQSGRTGPSVAPKTPPLDQNTAPSCVRTQPFPPNSTNNVGPDQRD